VAKADVAQFDQVAQLLNALGNWRNVLLDKLDNVDKEDKTGWQALANKVAEADVINFQQVGALLVLLC
jgi:hypothetical protein